LAVEYVSHQWADDPDAARAHSKEWAAQKRAKAAIGRQKLLHRMAAAQQGLCAWCWHPLPADLSEAELDHIIPRCRGGPDPLWNRQLLHKRCNGRGQGKSRKGAKGIEITPEAEALAAKHGITIKPPPIRAPRGSIYR
jgi:5-methylcytosine-specific restriction endonuclease McrA